MSQKKASPTREAIERQADHLARMIDDLLDMKHIVAGVVVLERQPCDLADAVTGLIAMLNEAGRFKEARPQHLDVILGLAERWSAGRPFDKAAAELRAGPALGHDTDEVLAGLLGTSPAEIAALRAEGVIQTHMQLAEGQLTQRLFAQIIRRSERLAWHPT